MVSHYMYVYIYIYIYDLDSLVFSPKNSHATEIKKKKWIHGGKLDSN